MVDIVARIMGACAWGAIALVLFFVVGIARFYEKSSGERTHYQVYLLPLAVLLYGAARYTLMGHDFQGDPLADMAMFLGGTVAAVLAFRLQVQMTGER